MIFTLLSHQWKSFWRARGAVNSLPLQVFLGFIILCLLLFFLLLGFSLKQLLHKLFPGQDVTRVYCGLILYYFAIDVPIRFIVQQPPVLSLQPYLILNIRRRQLVTWLNTRSLFHFLNLLPIFIFLPLVFTNIAPAYGSAAATTFTTSILFLTLFNHFGMLYMIRKAHLNTWWLIGFIAVVGIFAALDYFHLLSASAFSAFLFTKMLHQPLLALAPLALAIAAYANNRRLLLNNLYVEELSRKGGKKRSAEYTWLQQWGMTGELVGLDIRLILRNKLPRIATAISLLSVLYGLVFYRRAHLQPFNYTMLLFVALYISGQFNVNYGRFAFAWQGSCFDGLLTSNLPVSEYIRGKLLLFSIATTIVFILCSFYGFIDRRLLLIQAVAYLYDLGFNSMLTICFATYCYKSIRLTRSASSNHQGTGAATWLYGLVVMLIPFVIYLPFGLTGHHLIGLTVLGLIGIVGLLFRNRGIEFLTKEFYKRKYLILEGFRER